MTVMTIGIDLRPAEPGDVPYIEDLLSTSGLPTADVADQLGVFSICERESGRIGVGGLERVGDVALLRSVAIDESRRGMGYGTRMCDRLLARARDAKVTAVYLLTTTAPGFFARLGFERTERGAVPGSIRGTREFSELCPDSAVCMKRSLDTGL